MSREKHCIPAPLRIQSKDMCSTKKTISCAVIGTGRIGSSLETDRLREKPSSHAGAIAHNRETRLAAGVDSDPERLSAFGRLWRLPEEALFGDVRTMVERIHPGIVHISADTDSHIPLLLECLALEVPVIVLEKPVGATLAEARSALAAVQAAEKEGTSRVVVNHERRFAADYRRVKTLIDSGEMGELLSVHCRLFMGRTREVSKVLWHDGTHLVDILRFLVGPWEVEATHGNIEEKIGNFLVVGRTLRESVSGTAITIEISPGRDHLVFELDLSFSKGRIRVGNGVYEEWVSRPSPYYEQFRSLELRTPPGKSPFKKTGYFAGMMAHAVEVYRDRTVPGKSTFEDGLADLEILDRIIASGLTGQGGAATV